MIKFSRGKLRIRKQYLLFFIILICNKINGFVVLDTTILSHYEDFRIDINNSDFKSLLKIPYIDSEKASIIIKARKKWGNIMNRRMFTYIIGRENAALIAPYITYNKPKIGFRPESNISIRNDKRVVDFSLLYKGRRFKSFLFFNLNDKLLRYYSLFKWNGYRFIIGSYTTSFPFLTGGEYPFRVYKYRSEKRVGMAIAKQVDLHSFLLSGKYGVVNMNDNRINHLKTEFLYSFKYHGIVMTAALNDSLLFLDKEKNNNFRYGFIINGDFNNINNALRFDIRRNEIKTVYKNYYKNEHIQFYNNICFYYPIMDDYKTDLLLNGRFRKDKLIFNYYIKDEYSGDSTQYYYKLGLRRLDICGKAKFISGIYSISRSGYISNYSFYPNFLAETDFAGMKMGMFLNIMISAESKFGIKGELLSCFLDCYPFPNLRISLSSIMFNVQNDYRFENIADKYSGTGSLSSRGVIFKGEFNIKMKLIDCDLAFYLKKNPILTERAELTLTRMF